VGLATPITDVSPVSGHVIAEMTDLLFSVWVVVLGGTIIAVINSFSIIGLVVERVDQVFLSRAAKAQALYMSAEGMDFEDFKQVSNGAHDNDMDHE